MPLEILIVRNLLISYAGRHTRIQHTKLRFLAAGCDSTNKCKGAAGKGGLDEQIKELLWTEIMKKERGRAGRQREEIWTERGKRASGGGGREGGKIEFACFMLLGVKPHQ